MPRLVIPVALPYLTLVTLSSHGLDGSIVMIIVLLPYHELFTLSL